MKRHVITALLLCMALCMPAFSQAQGEGTDKPMLDIVWLVDTTGSMDKSIYIAKNHMDSFHNVLKDSFDVRYGLAPFGDVTVSRWAPGWDWPEVTKPILMNESRWTSAVEVLKNHLEIKAGALPRYWGEDTPETSTNAIITTVESYDWRPGAIREIVLVTDAPPKDAKEYTVNEQKVKVYSQEEVIQKCKDNNVSVCLADANANSCSDDYSNMIPALGGISKTYNEDTSTEPIALWIYNTPLVITQPVDCNIRVGQNATFTAASLSGKAVKYQWYTQADKLVKEGTTTGPVTLTVSNAQKTLNGTQYYCRFINTATDDARTIDTQRVTLRIASDFEITTQPKDQRVEVGQNAGFTVAAMGDGLTYQWQKQSGSDWVNMTGETGATLSLSQVTPGDNGSVYRCVVKDMISDYTGGKTLTSEEATLTVAAAPAITLQPQDVCMEAGQNATFTIEATGDKVTYQWQQQINGVWTPMDGETDGTLTVPASMEKNGRRYRCVVKSSFGTTITSDEVTLTVFVVPQTGDSSPLWLWAALCAASLLGIAVLRRRNA